MNMSRVLTLALFLAFAIVPCAAQRGGHGAGGMAHAGVRVGGGFRTGGFHGSGFRGGVGFHSGGFRSGGVRVFIGNHGFRGSRFGFHRRAFYPYYPFYAYDPFWFGSYGYSSFDYGSAYDSSAAYSQQINNQLNDLSSEVRQLRDQNDQLRYDVEQRQQLRFRREIAPREDAEPEARAQSSAPAPSAQPISTVLVYRDGHRAEIGNYAITGQTLWILSEKRATKVPLSALDLAQTAKVNQDRGVEFVGGPHND
jgi:hypothetical protein